MPGDPCPHLRGIPFLPPLLGLFVVLLAQLLYLSFPLFTLLVEHFTHTAYGFLLFKRHPVGIRFLLPHLIGDHAVNDVVGDLLHRCVTIPGKRILINRVHAVQHIRNPIELVGLGIHVTGEIALAEHLRHLRIDRIYRYAVCLVQLHCAHVLFAELVVVIHLSVEKDLLPLQIIPDFQQLRAVLCQLRRVVHDFFSHALCVRHQVGHAYVLLHHSLAQRLHVGLNVRVLYVAVIPPDGIQPQPLHVPQHYGRLLADTHFALQVLHSLFQCAVAAGQRRALPLQVAHLLLNVRCAPQLKSGTLYAVHGIQPCFFISAGVLDHPHTGVFQRCLYLCAGVVRDDRCQHFIKTYGSLRFCLEIPGRHIGNVFIQLQHLFRRIRFDLQRGVCPQLFVNRRNRPFCPQCLYNSRRRIVRCNKLISRRRILDLVGQLRKAFRIFLPNSAVFFFGHFLQPPGVGLDLVNRAVIL